MQPDIRYDCRRYTGYRPCGKQPVCTADCAHYVPRGRRILIIKLGAMGDVLRSTPILHGLRRAEEPCTITWLTDPESEFLLRHNPLIDRVLTWGHDASIITQGETFDLLINLEKEQRALALDALIRAPEKRGFGLHPTGALMTHNKASDYALRLGIDDDLKFRRNEKSMPRIVAEMAEVPYDRDEYILGIGDCARAFGREFAQSRGLDRAEGPVIGLNTGCGGVFPTKQWPPEHFLDLIQILRERRPECPMVLLGGPREAEINARLQDLAGCEGLTHAGVDNSLEEFCGILDACDIVVSSDSLAMHLGIALRKQVVALLGPTSATEIDLYDRGEILTADFDCAPCYRKDCERDPNCMAAILPNDAARSVERMCIASAASRSSGDVSPKRR